MTVRPQKSVWQELKELAFMIVFFAVVFGMIDLLDAAAHRLLGDSTYFWRVFIVSGVLLVLGGILEGRFKTGAVSLIAGRNIGYTVLGIVVCVLGPGATVDRTWTVSLPLLVVLAVLSWAHARSGATIAAIKATLAPAAAGLMISLMLVAGFQVSGARAATVWMIQKWIAWCSHFTEKWLDPGWVALTITLAALATVSYFIPRWKPVGHFVRVKTLADKLAAVVAMLASIGFIGGPKIDQQVKAQVDEQRSEYSAAWQREREADIEAALAPQIEKIWKSSSPAEKRSVQNLAARLNPDPEVRERVLRDVVSAQERNGNVASGPQPPDLSEFGSAPGGLTRARHDLAVIAAEKQQAGDAERRRDEAWEALKEVFSEGAAALVPSSLSGQVASFFRNLATIKAEEMFRDNVRPALEKASWIPLYWKPDAYDAQTGRSALTELVAVQVESERRKAQEEMKRIQAQRIEEERRAVEEHPRIEVP